MNTGFEVKTGYYSTVGVEDTTPFNFNIGMSLADRAATLNFVVDTIVNDKDKTYYSILKDYVFKFAVIRHMTDIDVSYVFDKDSPDANHFVNQIEKIIDTTNIYEIIHANNLELMESLYKSLNDMLTYKTGVREDRNNLITTIGRVVNMIFEGINDIDEDRLSTINTLLGGISEKLNEQPHKTEETTEKTATDEIDNGDEK